VEVPIGILGGFGGNFGTFNLSETCWSGDAYIFLQFVQGADPWDTPFWEVSMTGTIYQHVEGDIAANAFNNDRVPLW
jgi:hypothetical protein